MKKTVVSSIGAVFLMLAAASPVRSENVLGIGSYECSYYLEHSADVRFENVLYHWVGGFYSGLNAFSWATQRQYRDFNISDGKSIKRRMLSEILLYCYDYPDHLIVQGAEKAYFSLPVRKVPE